MGACLSRRKPEPVRRKRHLSQYPPVFSFTSEPFQFPCHVSDEEVADSCTLADVPPPPPPKESKPATIRSVESVSQGNTVPSSTRQSGRPSSVFSDSNRALSSEGSLCSDAHRDRSQRNSTKAESIQTVVESDDERDA